MFRLTKQVFIALLSFSGSWTSMVNVSNLTTYIFLLVKTLMNTIKDCVTIYG